MSDSKFQYDVFLSHSSADKPSVEQIGRMLVEQARLRPFLDKWHLVPGAEWQPALEDAIGQSATVAVFFGPKALGPWHNEEMQLALARAVRTRSECRIIPVLIPGAVPEQLTGFLSLRTWVDFRSGLDNPESLSRLVAGIKGEVTEPHGFNLPDEPAPYRGLQAFQATDASIFFGRHRECADLVERLKVHSLVAIVGCSGSGKSSLVRAGLVPALRRGELLSRRDWKVLIVRPGREPLRAIGDQVSSLLSASERPKAADDLTARMTLRRDGLRTALTAYLSDCEEPIFIFVDQFEELFTQSRDATLSERKLIVRFIENLSDLVSNSGHRYRVVIALRADFLEHALHFPILRDLLQDSEYLLGELGQDQIRECVVRPAQVVGAFLEAGLVDLILRDVEGQRAVLPLLQHALHELWLNRCGAWLTLEKYRAMGGIGGALQQRAQQTLEAMSPEQQVLAKSVLLQMIALGEGVADTRRRVERRELYPRGVPAKNVDEVIERLAGADARLIVVDDGKAEVTHEALIQNWQTLRDWLNEDRESLRLARQIEDAADAWQEHLRNDDYLWSGSRLAVAEEWLTRFGGRVTDMQTTFVLTSVNKRDAQAMADEIRRRKQISTRNRWIGTLCAVCIVAVVLAATAAINYDQALKHGNNARQQERIAKGEAKQARLEKERAQRETRVAISQRLATDANSVGTSFPLQRLLLAVAGARVTEQDGLVVPIARQAIYDALLTGGGGTQLCLGIESAFASPDGKWLLTIGNDTNLLLWDLNRPAYKAARVLGNVEPKQKAVAAFSSNGRYLAVCPGSNELHVWDLDSNESARVFKAPSEAHYYVAAAAISSDGRWFVSGGTDCWLWDLQASEGVERCRALKGHQGSLFSVAISPGGHYCATGASDGTARLWDLTTHSPAEKCLVLSGHEVGAEVSTFSPDGRWLLTVDVVGVARLWDPRAADPMDSFEILNPYHGESHVLRLSRDSRFVSIATAVGSVAVWDLTATVPKRSVQVIPHINPVGNKTLRMIDSRWLATETQGGVKLYDVSAPDPRRTVRSLRGHDGRVDTAGVSKDGNLMWTKGSDGTVRTWDLTAADPGKPLTTLRGSEYQINAVYRQCSNRCIVSCACDDGVIRYWRDDTGFSISGHHGPVLTTAISQDCRWLVSGGEDSTVRLWDLMAAAPELSGRIFQGHSSPVTAVDLTPDGRWLVTASDDQTAIVWELTGDGTATPVHTVHGHAGGIKAVDITPDGRWLVTGGMDATSQVWDLNAADPSATFRILRGHTAPVRTVAVTADSRWLVSGSDDKTARVWDLTKDDPGASVRVLRGPTGSIRSVAITDDGKWIATGSDDKSVACWDRTAVDSDTTETVKRGSTGKIVWVQIETDQGKPYITFASSEDKTISQWIPHKGNNDAWPVREMKEERGVVIASSVDGRWVVTLTGAPAWRLFGTARLWDLHIPGSPGHFLGGYVTHATISLDGSWLAISETNGTIRLWDLRTGFKGDPSFVIRENEDPIISFLISHDGRWLVTNRMSRPPLVSPAATHDPADPSNTFHTTGGTAHVWDLTALDQPNGDRLIDGLVSQLALSADGRWLATAGVDNTVRLWHLHALKRADPIHVLNAKAGLEKLDFSPGGNWLMSMHSNRASVPPQNSFTLWDLTSHQTLFNTELQCTVHSRFVHASDGDAFLAIYEDEVHAHELRTGKAQKTRRLLFKTVPSLVSKYDDKSVAVSLDGRQLVVCHGECLRLFDVNSAEPERFARTLRGHGGRKLQNPIFSSDGRWLVATSEVEFGHPIPNSDFVLVWDLRDIEATGTAVILQGLSRPTFLAGPRPRLLCWSGSSAVLLPLNTEELLELAISAAGRKFSNEERTRFLGSEELKGL